MRYSEEKQYALELINEHRARKGLPTMILGDNVSAQIHAELSLQDCHSSPWSTDGLNPVARYTLVGGYQDSHMVVSGVDYCGDREEREFITNQKIRDVIDSLLNPEWGDYFGEQILASFENRHYSKLNVGLVRDSHDTTAVFLLEKDYIEFEELPVFEEGLLTLSGRVKNGATLEDPEDLNMALEYHQPPRPLTAGQLARVYSSTLGIRVANIRRPAGEGRYWPNDEITKMYYRCITPYHESLIGAPPVESRAQASELHNYAKEECRKIQEDKVGGEERTVPWITASQWNVANGNFTVTADLSEVLHNHGNGIYTLFIWGIVDEESVLISGYAIFHGIPRPTGYSPP